MADAKSKYILEAEDRTGGAFKSVQGHARETAGKVAAAGLAAGAAVGAAAIATINTQRQSIDVLAKTADQLGITTEKLVGLRHAAEQTAGLQEGQFDKALQTMVKGLSEAAAGSGEAQQAIKDLGLDAAQLAAMSPDQAMYAISDAMAGVANQGERVRIAMKLFGEEGSKLVNTLGGGSGRLAEFQAEAEALGIAISRVDAAQVEAANDSLDRAKKVATGFGNALTVAAAPAIEEVSNMFVNAANDAGGFGELANTAIGVVVKAVGLAGNVLRGWGMIWVGLKAVVNSFVGYAIDGIRLIAKPLIKLTDMIPGLNINIDETLASLSDDMHRRSQEAQDSLAAMAMEPMPLEQTEEWFAKIQERAKTHAEEIVATTREKNAAIVESETDTQNKLLKNKVAAATDSLKQDQATFKSALSRGAQHSKALFNLQKTFEIAQAVLALKSTVISSYKYGSSIGGPILGAVFAGIGGAAQLAHIAGLKGASFGGGSGGGGSGGGGSVPSVSALSDQSQSSSITSVSGTKRLPTPNISIDDDGIFSGKTVRRFAEMLQEYYENGGEVPA